jgi:hypothetical protein
MCITYMYTHMYYLDTYITYIYTVLLIYTYYMYYLYILLYMYYLDTYITYIYIYITYIYILYVLLIYIYIYIYTHTYHTNLVVRWFFMRLLLDNKPLYHGYLTRPNIQPIPTITMDSNLCILQYIRIYIYTYILYIYVYIYTFRELLPLFKRIMDPNFQDP